MLFSEVLEILTIASYFPWAFFAFENHSKHIHDLHGVSFQNFSELHLIPINSLATELYNFYSFCATPQKINCYKPAESEHYKL